MGMKRIGILLSGRGSNMVALAEAMRNGSIPEATIALVISNRPEAAGRIISNKWAARVMTVFMIVSSTPSFSRGRVRRQTCALRDYDPSSLF